MKYAIRRAVGTVQVTDEWDSPAWRVAQTLDIACFHAKGSGHRPVTRARLLFDDQALFVHFRVDDRYVRSIHTANQTSVCKDSCVELFIRPREDTGYFNFEVNAGGAIHLSYVEDPTPTGHGFKKFVFVSDDWLGRIALHHTLPRLVEPEIKLPVTWRVAYRVPWELFEAYAGPLRPVQGSAWSGNLYKCADDTSHPHWASWSPLGDRLSFHQPRYFAPMNFEKASVEPVVLATEPPARHAVAASPKG